MGGANVRSARRRYRRARRLRENRRGVVAVIGTLLALLVFFALFGIFLTQYVPLWMTDNESQFTSQAAASFLTFKSYVDSQYISGGPLSYGTPFTVSSQGVPLLAQPTQGTLVFLPTTCPTGFITSKSAGVVGQPTNPAYCVFQNITLSVGPGASAPYYQKVPSGVLEMLLPNRYFNAQTFYFEDDGVVQSQGGVNQIMAVAPPFNATNVAGNTTFTTSFLQLYGNASTVIGQGSEQVFSHLRYTQTLTSNGKVVGGVLQPFSVSYEIGTQYPCAWQRFFMAQMNVSGVPFDLTPSPGVTSYNWTNPITHAPSIPVANSACTSQTGLTTILAVNLNAVTFTRVFYAGVQIALGIGGT